MEALEGVIKGQSHPLFQDDSMGYGKLRFPAMAP
jgi:hypothetical protein